MKRILTLLVLAASLQGCVFVVGAAAGAVAIAVVYDHRTIQHVLEDTSLTNKVIARIRAVPELRKESHIEVTVYDHTVLLTGETPKAAWRQQAEALAKSVAGVRMVYNQISLQGPTSALTRTSDSWITTKIKSMMLANTDLRSGNIKVETEGGVVYLMGSVTHEQADIAVDISRQVSGVQRVIKIFQYKNS